MHKLVANLAILALALLTSCAPEAPSDPAGGYRVKAASSAPDWRQGDSLSVLDNAGNHPFVLQSSGRESAISGIFQGAQKNSIQPLRQGHAL